MTREHDGSHTASWLVDVLPERVGRAFPASSEECRLSNIAGARQLRANLNRIVPVTGRLAAASCTVAMRSIWTTTRPFGSTRLTDEQLVRACRLKMSSDKELPCLRQVGVGRAVTHGELGSCGHMGH